VIGSRPECAKTFKFGTLTYTGIGCRVGYGDRSGIKKVRLYSGCRSLPPKRSRWSSGVSAFPGMWRLPSGARKGASGSDGGWATRTSEAEARRRSARRAATMGFMDASPANVLAGSPERESPQGVALATEPGRSGPPETEP
jgi:hypothetical protein